MIKKISKKLNEFVFNRGYNKGLAEGKRREKDQQKHYEDVINTLIYNQNTILIEKEKDNSTMVKKLKANAKLVRDAEVRLSEINRKERQMEKYTEELQDKLEGLTKNVYRPIQDVLMVTKDIENITRKKKSDE